MKFLSSSQLSEHRYKTPEGYLVCLDCILSRTGKQQYQMSDLFTDGDDTEVDVDRPFDEVFNEKTLASFENKPFTNEHPSTDVNPNNYNELSVGFVRDIRKGSENGRDVMIGNIVVTDPETIRQIEDGEKTELSCGYDCDIVKDDNGNYKQTNIRGNHVALCERGRAGIARIVDSNKVKDDIQENISYGNGKLKILNKIGKDTVVNEDFYYVEWNGHKRVLSAKGIEMIVKHNNLVKDAIDDSINDSDYDEYINFLYLNTKYSKEELFKIARDYFNKGLSKYEALTKIKENDFHKDSVKDNKTGEQYAKSNLNILNSLLNSNQHGEVVKTGSYWFDTAAYAYVEFKKQVDAKIFYEVIKNKVPSPSRAILDALNRQVEIYQSYPSLKYSDIVEKRLRELQSMGINTAGATNNTFDDYVVIYVIPRITQSQANKIEEKYGGTRNAHLAKRNGIYISHSANFKDSINDEYVVRKSDIHQPHFLQKAKSLGFDVEETNLEYILRGGNDDMYKNLMKDSIKDSEIVNCPDMSLQEMKEYCEMYQCEVYNTGVIGKYRLEGKDVDEVIEELKADGFIEDSVKDSNKDYYQLKEELNACKTKEDYHKWLQEVKSNDNISSEEMDKLIYFYNNMKDIKDSIKDSLSSEVRNWWKKVEEANRTKNWGFDIDNNGCDDEDMLMAMFDMISVLKGKDNNLYQEGKRIYNKYSQYSQYKDSINDKLSGNGEVHFLYEGGKIISYVYNRNNKTPSELVTIAKKYGCDVNSKNGDWKNVELVGQAGKEENLCKAWHEINPAYSVNELMSLHDSIKDGINLTPTSEPGQDRPIYVMQSDADSNLYFYIGKTYAMKDGEWTYAKYKMNGNSPEQVKQELERNGWHQVNKGPAPIIDSKVKDEDKKEILHKYGFINNGSVLRHPKGPELKFKYHGIGFFLGGVNQIERKLGIRYSYIDENNEEVWFFKKDIEDSVPTNVAQIAKIAKIAKATIDAKKMKDSSIYEVLSQICKKYTSNFGINLRGDLLKYEIKLGKEGAKYANQIANDINSQLGYKLRKVRIDNTPLNDIQCWIDVYPNPNYFKDSIKDSPASDIMAEIKKAYPQVQVHAENTFGSSGGNSIKFTFSNVPEDTSNWKKFLSYLLGKYAPKTSSYSDIYSMVINNDVNADMKEKILHSKLPIKKEEIKKYFPAGSYAFINFTNNTKSVENNDNLKLFFYRSGGFKYNVLLPDVNLNNKYIFIERLGGGYDYIQQLDRSYNTSGKYREGKITYDSVTKDDDVDEFMKEQYKSLGKPIGKYKEFVIYQSGNKYHVTKSVDGSIVKTNLNSLQEAKEVINKFKDSVKDEKVKTPRGEFELVNKTEEELKKEGYSYHHSGNGYKVFIKNNQAVAIKPQDSKPIKDATSNECIEKLKTVSIPEGMQFQYGDMSTTMVQIQNVGKKEVFLNLQTGSSSTKELSNAWGRIWKNGKLIFNEQDAINIVRAHMVEKLRMFQDSKKITDSDATEIFNEIKSKYPGLKFYEVNYKDMSKDPKSPFIYISFSITGNLPQGLNRFNHVNKEPFERYVIYVLQKHGFKKPFVDTIDWYGQLKVSVQAFKNL